MRKDARRCRGLRGGGGDAQAGELVGASFWRMLTTSTDVQLQRAISTASIGLGPCVVRGVRVEDNLVAVLGGAFEDVCPASIRCARSLCKFLLAF